MLVSSHTAGKEVTTPQDKQKTVSCCLEDQMFHKRILLIWRKSMASPKNPGKKEETKQGIPLVKLSELSKAELAKINLDDLWIMRPERKTAGKPPTARGRYCGCRNVCIV